MTLLVLAGVFAVVFGAWVIHPLIFGRWGLIGDVVPAEVVERENKKRVALAALKDVEYERAAGKLDEADYREVRARLEREALAAIRRAEGADPGSEVAVEAGRLHGCGFTNPEGSRYCAGCGERVK